MVMTIMKGIIFSAFTTAFMACGWHFGKEQVLKFSKLQNAAAVLLLFWSMLVVYMTLLTFTCDPIVSDVGFTPFHTLQEIFLYRQTDLIWQVVFNIIMFMPFGFLLPVLFKELRSMSMMLTIGLVLTLAIECTQLFIGRSFDVDDVICNSLGSMAGYVLFKACWLFVKVWKHQAVHHIKTVLEFE